VVAGSNDGGSYESALLFGVNDFGSPFAQTFLDVDNTNMFATVSAILAISFCKLICRAASVCRLLVIAYVTALFLNCL